MRSMLLALLVCAAPLPSQIRNVHDVGLTMDGGALTVIFGQACGAFTCAPFPAGPLTPTAANTRTRTVTVHGAPSSIYVLGLSQAPLATPCVVVPGIDNALMLGTPATILAFGVTSAGGPSTSAACRQGQGRFTLTVPGTVPPGSTFLLQALTMSASTGGPAFTVGLRATIR
jgi:hypothetical protein